MTTAFKRFTVSQAIGSFIDNAFKMLAVIYLFSVLNRDLAETLAVATALFVIPFLLFSNWAGALADRMNKRSLVMAIKWVEIVLLLLAFPALRSGLGWPLYAVIFLLSAQSAFFGPVKRGIVPELVVAEELSRANGLMTGASYIGIVAGIFLPSLMVTYLRLDFYAVLVVCVAISAVGLLSARRLPSTPAAGRVAAVSPWVVPDAVRVIRSLSAQPWLQRAAGASVAFSGLAALFQQNLVVYAREVVGLSVEAGGFLFLFVAVGIAAGAWLTGRYSRHAVELGLVPVGVSAMALAVAGLALTADRVWMAALLFLSGAAAGMCVVPLTAYMQGQAPADRRGEIFGAVEFWSFAAMVLSSGLFYALSALMGLGARGCMAVTAAVCALAALWAVVRLPGFTVRFLLARLTRLLYRVEVCGLENLPKSGGALLAANHTAYADACIIQSVTSRPVRYVMSREVFTNWGWCRPLFKLIRAIPIDNHDGPRALVRSLAESREALVSGSLVGIFPEGELSRTGTMQAFHKGFEKIAKGTACPIIPIHLDNLWGSIFSFRDGEPGLRWPRRLPLPVTLRIGRPLPSDASAEDVRQAVAELGAETAAARAARPGNTLARRLLARVRGHWFRPAVSDTLGRSLTYGRLLTAAVALNRRLAPVIGEEARVGILLPPSVAGVLANAAVTLQGRTAVNLNWTVAAASFRTAVAQAGIRFILTSRRFIGQVAVPEVSARLLFIEDLLVRLSWHERLAALLRARFAPLRALAGGREPQAADIACVLFSSGSTGTPKGVLLSHANLLANLDALHTVMRFGRRDALCATLPLFHSFGYLGTLWWPLLTGVRAAYHANPLQTAQVVGLIRERRLTILFTTPTLLQGYLKRAAPADLATLRHIVTGGEKLSLSLADACEQALGVRPLEGYGATELSPVALLSLPNRTIGAFRCVGNKPGSAGRPLPNIAVRIVDPDTGAALPAGSSGLLLVTGANVMQGYLNDPGRTAEALRDGWYVTGDIARVDADGFVYLTDRLSRFSKIGGEMVPHGAVEEALQRACGFCEPCVAVVGVPDAAKGEELVVCHTPQAGDPDALLQALKQSGLPNLWLPRRANFIAIGAIPVLGTGKVDIRAVRDHVLRQRHYRLCA